ncbi:MAG: ABC transporter permease subunit [Bdellovibrionaceae bacterium]|jgi:microcin C transport system permease protein|nr:ABC transporter permease subunit [Pseudobdellovibrionaceae bacterium]
MQLSPLALKQIKRFKSIKRGYYSFIAICVLVALTLIAELLINSRALFVSYEGNWYFPTYGSVISGKTFGLNYDYETNYRDLQEVLKKEGKGTVIMPLVPYNPLENDFREGIYPPSAPSSKEKHYLGTDSTGRDVVARLFYGFRIAIFFSLLLLVCNYTIGVSVGSAMGFLGGRFDMIMQRIIEIWSNIPFLYVVIIVASIITPNIFTLMGIMLFFGWMAMTWQMRTTTYKERSREYVMAAKSLGASRRRIIFNHILPNSIFIIVSFIPFSISGGIVALTSLDYLGFGLPAPTPSWGELLRQGTNNLEAGWIVSSVVVFMIIILVMVTFIGEAVREAFDPKKHTTYE